jgi:hypothetical protein
MGNVCLMFSQLRVVSCASADDDDFPIPCMESRPLVMHTVLYMSAFASLFKRQPTIIQSIHLSSVITCIAKQRESSLITTSFISNRRYIVLVLTSCNCCSSPASLSGSVCRCCSCLDDSIIALLLSHRNKKMLQSTYQLKACNTSAEPTHRTHSTEVARTNDNINAK